MDSLWFDHLTDYSGAIHVHTVKSDGVGTLGEVVSAAERAGLGFLIITDHDTRGYADEGGEGWHGKVLLVAGEEVSVGSNRFIVIGHGDRIGERADLQQGLEDAHRKGGITIALPPEDATAQLPTAAGRHPHPPHPPDPEADADSDDQAPPPQLVDPDWPLRLVDGWEFWCGLEDWARGRVDRKTMTNPFERIEHIGLRGPRRRAVRMWDDLTLKAHILGFAGLNAHGRAWTTGSPGAALPYETLFRTLTTHVLAPELPLESSDIARNLLLNALRRGHFHTAQSGIAPPHDFRFIAQIPDRPPLLQGDTAPFHPHALLRVRLPRTAEIRLLHNGNPVLAAEGDTLDFPAVAPGVYRVEVWHERHPWIFSNPIWFTQPTPEEWEGYRSEAQRDTARASGSTFEDLLDLAT